MSRPPSILSASLHNLEVNNLNILFSPNFDIQTADFDLFNKYVIYKFNQYVVGNIKDYSLWDSIQMDFANFEAKRFDELDNAT